MKNKNKEADPWASPKRGQKYKKMKQEHGRRKTDSGQSAICDKCS